MLPPGHNFLPFLYFILSEKGGDQIFLLHRGCDSGSSSLSYSSNTFAARASPNKSVVVESFGRPRPFLCGRATQLTDYYYHQTFHAQRALVSPAIGDKGRKLIKCY